MRKFVTKFAAISMAAMMAVAMTACNVSVTTTSEHSTEYSTEAPASVANPVSEVTEEEMVQKTGIDLPLPEGATDVVYSVIDTDQGQIAQVDFNLNGQKMYLRAVYTDLTSLNDVTDDGAVPEYDNTKGDISGLNYEWNASALNLVQDREAIVNVNKAGVGYIAWLDVVPGILYNLCMEENADADKLVETANQLFVPMQGEAE